MRTLTLPLLLALAGSMLPAKAERFAVLAGVGDYQGVVKGLEGPAFDLPAIQKTLLQGGYSADRIVVLLDGEATRSKILAALTEQVARMKDGDHLLFYFSGHGTSAFDSNTQPLSPAIGPDSGALVPVDFSTRSLTDMVNSLIVGRRDLRPIFSRIPPGAQAFVILDACYSENAVKSIGVLSLATSRGIAFVPVQKAAGASQVQSNPTRPPVEDTTPYPYSNVVALAAASKSQTALDIGRAALAHIPTVDGNPHGALTNSLLRGLSGPADTNRDGGTTYDELFRFVRRDMEGTFPHQPQLLYSPKFALAQLALGGAKDRRADQRPPVPPAAKPSAMEEPLREEGSLPRLRVRIVGDLGNLITLFQKEPEVVLVDGAHDVLILKSGGWWELYDSSSALIQRLPKNAGEGSVVTRVKAQIQLIALRNWSNPSQTYNVRVDAEPVDASGYDRLRTTFRVGERLRFRISSERKAYLLLLAINKDGRIAILFPGHEASEQSPQLPNRSSEFLVEAKTPAGSEQVKVIGFTDRPDGWATWACTASACPDFAPSDSRLGVLMRMLKESRGVAEASLRIITLE